MNSVSVFLFGIFLIAGIIYIYLGGYILYVNIRESLNRIFALVTISLSVWAFSFAIAIVAQDFSNALFWRRVSSIGWGLFYALMLQFIMAMLQNSSLSKMQKYKFGWKYIFLYIPAAISIYVFGISSKLSTQLYNLTRTQFGWRNVAVKSVWDYFFNAYYISYSLIGITLLIIFSKRTKLIREKKQLVIIISSFVICFLIGSITDIVLDYYVGIELPESGIIFILIPIIAIWYVIRKYGLMVLSLGSVSEDILSRMSEGLILMDSNGVIVMVNNSLIKLTGYTMDEMLGQKLKIIFENQNNTVDMESTWDKLMCSNIDGIEDYATIKDGDIIPIILSGTRIVDQWGDLVGVVCILTDVSEIRAREIELLLTQKELEVALHKANVALEAKTQFLATISHEIRTPMNSIIGMSYLALKSDLNDQQRGYVNKIQKATNSLLGIINDILDFSKIESEKIVLEQIEFDVDATISKSIGKFTEIVDEKQLLMIYNYPNEIPQKVIGDSVRLEQILTNIIDNAVKFTENGEIEIDVVEQERAIDSICLHFSVRDTGIGISKENKDDIFNVFTQIDSSTTRQFSGIGLGLAITKSLVEMMDGEIWIESQLDKGSTISFTACFKVKKEYEKVKDCKKSIHKQTDNEVMINKNDEPIITDIDEEVGALLLFLSKGDSLAVEKFDELREIIKMHISDIDYNYIRSRIRKYEFDEAGDRLKEVFYGKGK